MKSVIRILAVAVLAIMVAACSRGVEVDYQDAASPDVLRVQTGGEGYRDVLEYIVAQGLAGDVKLEITDAATDANSRIAEGGADLAFYQTQPAFLGNQQKNSLDTLSIVATAAVAPYALYSSKWKDLAETTDWVNSTLAADKVTGSSLPHGSIVVVPSTTAGFARGLYLLQQAGLMTLDRPFGGVSTADLSVSLANVLESQRHLEVRGLDLGTYAEAIYQNYDAVVFDPTTATAIGLIPDRDALAIESGPGNPYARVLVAPSRLAGDPRVSALAHALESPQVADYLASTYHGKFISTHTDPQQKGSTP